MLDLFWYLRKITFHRNRSASVLISIKGSAAKPKLLYIWLRLMPKSGSHYANGHPYM
jgi:hypothetical protein